MIGRGRPLWERNLSEAKRRFSSLEKVSTDAFYKAINRVDCNVLRTHADEVSYSLHPIIRMEIEEKLFHGDLRFDDVPAAWNEAYRRQLGLTVKNDREGVLQDAHWAMGFIGYFQSYLLGNLYSGMIREQIEKEMPDWERMIATEGCKELNEWMDCNVRQYGAAFTGPELIRRITGKPLCADPYIHYIKEKYTDIYEMRKEEKKC
jgi:carboxypeptidase Taq